MARMMTKTIPGYDECPCCRRHRKFRMPHNRTDPRTRRRRRAAETLQWRREADRARWA